ARCPRSRDTTEKATGFGSARPLLPGWYETVLLDTLPVNGRLQIRERESAQKTLQRGGEGLGRLLL
ncbi:MAG: hypothetical protein L0Y56_18315, partial [Nitrospira sp.]|nr:hypothetical protein [Nitrospira sp.]